MKKRNISAELLKKRYWHKMCFGVQHGLWSNESHSRRIFMRWKTKVFVAFAWRCEKVVKYKNKSGD